VLSAPQVPAASRWTVSGLRGRLLSAYARRMPEHPGKLRLLTNLSRSFRTTACHPAGGVVALEPQDYLGWSILITGGFEPASLNLAIDLMRRHGGTFVDIGANVGIYTVAITRATGCRTVAIEPEPHNFARLQANLALNPALAVTAVNCAATPTLTTVALAVTKPSERAWTHIGSASGDGGIEVPGRPLEQILREAGVASVTLIKIDVEGYEPEALAGLDWHGSLRPHAVLMECSTLDTAKHALMEGHGYDALTVDGRPCAGLDQFPEGNVLFTSRT
jgi:FkbM family methyltransferase